jgi:ribosomal protein L17
MKFRDLVSSEEGFQVVKSLVEALIQDARVSLTYIKAIYIKRVSRLIQLVKSSQHVVPRSSQKRIEHDTKDSS